MLTNFRFGGHCKKFLALNIAARNQTFVLGIMKVMFFSSSRAGADIGLSVTARWPKCLLATNGETNYLLNSFPRGDA